MTNIDIVKLTIKTIHDMMAEDKELRKILKKQVKDADGEIAIDWINDSLSHSSKTPGTDQRYAIDPTKIRNDLDGSPETMFAEGIVKTIKWNLDKPGMGKGGYERRLSEVLRTDVLNRIAQKR